MLMLCKTESTTTPSCRPIMSVASDWRHIKLTSKFLQVQTDTY